MNRDEKIARSNIERYFESEAKRLEDVYTTYSPAKSKALGDCWGLYFKNGGFDGIRILSHNTNAFTVGFMACDYKTDDVYFYYITKDHVRKCLYKNRFEYSIR